MSADPAGLLGENDATTAPRRRQCRGTAAGAATDDDNVGVQFFRGCFGGEDRKLQGEWHSCHSAQKSAASHGIVSRFPVLQFSQIVEIALTMSKVA
jgi:hypothetical protein